MSRPPVITALLDANVLYPAPLRDYLLYLAGLGVYEPVWTKAIQDEWIRNLLKARPDINRVALEATRRSMDKAFDLKIPNDRVNSFPICQELLKRKPGSV